MAQSTGASAIRSRQRALAFGSGPAWVTVGIWSPMRCRLTGGMVAPCSRDVGGPLIRGVLVDVATSASQRNPGGVRCTIRPYYHELYSWILPVPNRA